MVCAPCFFLWGRARITLARWLYFITDETEEEFEDLDVTLDESNVEFEFDFGTDSVAKELSVLAAFSDIA